MTTRGGEGDLERLFSKEAEAGGDKVVGEINTWLGGRFVRLSEVEAVDSAMVLRLIELVVEGPAASVAGFAVAVV